MTTKRERNILMINPTNYQLTFEPDLNKFTFKGKETLSFEVLNPTNKIELDAADLKITDVILVSESDKGKRAHPESVIDSGVSRLSRDPRNDIKVTFKLNEEDEKLYINVLETLKSGKYTLHIEFEGVLNDKLAGFYRSKYLSEGKEKYLATTQFEATDARRAFPCIDHPAYKATFNVTLIIDKNHTAISNTLPLSTYDVEEKAVPTGKKKVIFEKTPLMSTYLLYLGVGEFEFLEGKYKDVMIRVTTTPGKKEHGKFALDCAIKFLDFFEKYFQYPYPLKKLDLIAIPDFASGAMENWGAITFRETALLFYEGKSSQATKQRIAEVVAHELVHQWFGNLVTMKWWDDLWLNESFATYIAYKALDHYWPEWDIWSDYLTNTVFTGMAIDSLRSSHPIKAEVKNTKDIDELFDEIAYDKGGSILRMLNGYLGEKNFQIGLAAYIKEFKYQNAQGSDLWQKLQETGNEPITNIMEKFIGQVGFPKITVGKKGRKLIFQQKRFLLFENKDSQKMVWPVPVNLQYQKNSVLRFLLKKEESVVESPQTTSIMNINHDYSSFFISDYPDDVFKQFINNQSIFGTRDKLGFAHDLYSILFQGKRNLESVLDFFERFYVNEQSETILTYVIGKVTGTYLLIGNQQAKKLALRFSKIGLERVGLSPKTGELPQTAQLRSLSISILSLLQDSEVEKFIAKAFSNYLKHESSLHPDLRTAVYAGAVRLNENNYGIVKDLYQKTEIQEEKVKFLNALGAVKNKELLKVTLEFTSSSKVRFANILYLIASVAGNPIGKNIAFNWLINNWGTLVKKSGGLVNIILRRSLQSIIPTCAIGKVEEAEMFLKKNRIQGLEKTIDQVREELHINSRFVKSFK